MACKLLKHNAEGQYSDDMDQTEIMTSLMNSWFNRARSTEPMVVGSSNEDTVLYSMSKKEYVLDIYECGMFQSKHAARLAASPNAIAAMQFAQGEVQVVVVEVKTRVLIDKIAVTERMAKKYNHKVIVCNYGDDSWNECVKEDHSNQVMVQFLVTGLKHCCYIVSRPGTAGGKGRPIYMVPLP